MLRFKQYISEANSVIGYKAGHMSHIEDLVFDLGVEGTRKAIYFMRDVRDMLSVSDGNKRTVVTTKFDGSPAVIAGINPENGRFFVAKKGIFNKTPKLYYSHTDINADTSGDLANKLMVAFDECKKVEMKGIFQGDIMFTRDSLKRETIDGKSYITFHPNTIVYAVEFNSNLGKKISQSNIGIIWHTKYVGDKIQELKPVFGENIVSTFKEQKTSWMEDATFKDVTGVATFTDAERKYFDLLLSDIGKHFQRMPANVVNSIHKDEELLSLVHIYNNSKIKSGQRVKDITAHVNGLYEFIFNRYNNEITALKTIAAKDKKTNVRDRILSFFTKHPKSEIVAVFELSQKIADAKQFLINKMNSASNIDSFLKTRNGFRVTGAEGFVAISNQGAVKLVDRMEFSMANFSPEIQKGWQK